MPRKPLDAVRTNVYLPRKQDAALRNLADHSGVTFAEHLRRAVDFYIAFSDEVQSAVDRLAVEPEPSKGCTPAVSDPAPVLVPRTEGTSAPDFHPPFRTTVES